MRDIQLIHQKFYKRPTKLDQDVMLFKLCSIKQTKKRPEFKGKKKFTTYYSVFVNKIKVPICQKFFLNIFGIKKYRVEYLMKKFYETGEFPREARGGDRKAIKYADKRNSVHRFIQSLNCIEAHYCRKNKHAERKYLPCELNIKKIFLMFNTDQQNSQMGVKLSYFRHIFNTEYNIGFGTPQTDVCSKCLELREKVKREQDESQKATLIAEKRVHTLRAKSFFENLRETTSGLKIISFDFQKNLPLPKVPDQSCYYSRQLYFYNLAIVEGSSDLPLNKDRVFAYYCTENEFAKNANLVASCVYDRLNHTDKTGITRIRLVADGCGGQNKNSILIGMCCKWLVENIDVKVIEIIFPVTGHSFMPADRVFGIIEKKLRRNEVILDPKEMSDIISDNATLRKIGVDCPVYDWKTAVKDVLKPTTSWSIQFNQCKRFILRRSKQRDNVLVRGEVFYKSDIAKPQNICKPRKNMKMINQVIIPNKIAVNKAKLNDVKKLLGKHFGTEWESLPDLKFYRETITSQEDLQETTTDEIYCSDTVEDSEILRV